jgi:hypothetical protein
MASATPRIKEKVKRLTRANEEPKVEKRKKVKENLQKNIKSNTYTFIKRYKNKNRRRIEIFIKIY